MQKLTIFIKANVRITDIPKHYKDRVAFIVDSIPKAIPWADYKAPEYRLPVRSWIDAHTLEVKKVYGKNVDGVMFVLSPWQNGKHRIKGLQPSFTSNGYEVMFVRGDNDEVAFHEIKHLLDNLLRVNLGISAESLARVMDWDDDVVHHPKHRHDFEFLLDRVWPSVEILITKRRDFEKQNLLNRTLADLQIRINAMRNATKERVIPDTSPVNRLFEAAVASLGVDASPNDAAPDELGCADTVSNIIRKVLPDFPIITGTSTLWSRLQSDKRFERVGVPEVGAVIISPTGNGNGTFPGHTGICGEDGVIMSNNSYNGKFEANYTQKTWEARYMRKGGFPMMFYRLKNK